MLSFEEIEDCFPDGACTDSATGKALVSAQWLHDFAFAVAAAERKACSRECAPNSSLPNGSNPRLHTLPCLSSFPDGMTVAQLKAIVRDWPETDEYGDPCEVWVCDGKGLSNQARMATPLNMRRSKDDKTVWADFMLGHGA